MVEHIKVFYAEPPIATRDLEIHALGSHEWMPPCTINRPAGTGDILFMHFDHPVTVKVNGHIVACPAHTFIAWGPTDAHHYGNEQAKWCHSWMHCSGKLIESLFNACQIPWCTAIPDVDSRIIQSCIENIHGEISRNAQADAIIVENYLQNFTRELGRRQVTQGVASVPARWLALRRHLEECFDERVSLTVLAKRAHCSVPHVCAEFKRYFHTSPIDFVIRQRMHRARILLRDHNNSVTAIAKAVGYEDIHHFSKLFRKHHGISPRGMRTAGR